MRRLLLPVAVVAAACSGDGGGPRPQPFEPQACTLLWYRARTAGLFDLYKVEMPVADWTPGTHSYDGATRLGVFYYGLLDADSDGLFEQWADAASATSGSFTVGGAGVEDGDVVTFTDTSSQAYIGVGGALLATGGTGSFEGVWSPHEVEDGDADPEYTEDAAIALAYQGSSLSFGSDAHAAFGYCWTDALSASSRPAFPLPVPLWRPGANPP